MQRLVTWFISNCFHIMLWLHCDCVSLFLCIEFPADRRWRSVRVLFEMCPFIHSTYRSTQAGVTWCQFGFESQKIPPCLAGNVRGSITGHFILPPWMCMYMYTVLWSHMEAYLPVRHVFAYSPDWHFLHHSVYHGKCIISWWNSIYFFAFWASELPYPF